MSKLLLLVAVNHTSFVCPSHGRIALDCHRPYVHIAGVLCDDVHEGASPSIESLARAKKFGP